MKNKPLTKEEQKLLELIQQTELYIRIKEINDKENKKKKR